MSLEDVTQIDGVKSWTTGVEVEWEAINQLRNIAKLPILAGHVAVMPDVHMGKGATVGSVIPTRAAIVPSAVGVDIGCGMCAVRTDLTASQLPDSLGGIRAAIEAAVPVGFNGHESAVNTSREGLTGIALHRVGKQLAERYDELGIMKVIGKHDHAKVFKQLGTLGGGNHFIELCLDETQLYVEGLRWAQDYAAHNRNLMLHSVVKTLNAQFGREVATFEGATNCHHNYASLEEHFGKRVWITRKGAVSARAGELGIIPGSMGAKSFIVRGKGNAEAYCSCSHGAGRRLSRNAAKKQFTVADLREQTQGVECRKDAGVLDEIPGAYKSIDAVMAAQAELVEIVHTLKQVMCIKG